MNILLKQKFASIRRRLAQLAAVALVLQLAVMPGQANATAGILSNVQVSFQRMAASQTTLGTVCFKVGTTMTSTLKGIWITFPSTGTGSTSFTLGASPGTWTDGTSNNFWPAGASAIPSGGTPTTSRVTNVNTSDTIQISYATAQSLTAGTTYCGNWTTAADVTQPTAGAASNERGIVQTCDTSICSSPTNGVATNSRDLGRWATQTTSSTGDQFTTTAAVLAQFSFSLSGTSDNFTASIDNGAVQATTGINATIGANSSNGWRIWAKDANTGLTSANASKTIASTTPGTNATLAAGTEGYVTGVCVTTAGTGAPATATTVQATTAYKGNTTQTCSSQATGQGSGLDTTFREIANANGTTSGSVVQLQEKAAVSVATPAGNDYTDTITCVAAGSF